MSRRECTCWSDECVITALSQPYHSQSEGAQYCNAVAIPPRARVKFPLPADGVQWFQEAQRSGVIEPCCDESAAVPGSLSGPCGLQCGTAAAFRFFRGEQAEHSTHLPDGTLLSARKPAPCPSSHQKPALTCPLTSKDERS